MTYVLNNEMLISPENLGAFLSSPLGNKTDEKLCSHMNVIMMPVSSTDKKNQT
jgi:hypothetical protein